MGLAQRWQTRSGGLTQIRDIATREHWDSEHARSPGVPNYHELRPERLLREFIGADLDPRPGQTLVELGAGNTATLPHLARAFGYRVSGLDYSPLGCDLARRNLAAFGVEGDIVEGDIFAPPDAWARAFDVVMTRGVAEHFDRTDEIINAFAAYLAPGGRMLTVIPNMRGTPGLVQQFLSGDIYRRHVPLSPRQLAAAHTAAGLSVHTAGYLCGMNYWVANPGDKRGVRRWAVLPLLVLTRFVWAIEDRGLELPANGVTSPWVVVVASSSA